MHSHLITYAAAPHLLPSPIPLPRDFRDIRKNGLTKLGPPLLPSLLFFVSKGFLINYLQRGGGEKLQQMFLTPVLLGGKAVFRFNQLPAGSQAAVPASPDPGSNPAAKLPRVACGLKPQLPRAIKSELRQDKERYHLLP